MKRWLLAVVVATLAVLLSSPASLADARADRLPIPELISLAQHGNAAAQFELGQRYRLGLGVPENNPAALPWYLKSSDQGFPPAEDRVGLMYSHGKGGLPKDEARGLQLMERAASQGDSAAKLGIRIYRSAFYRWIRALR